MYFYRKNSKIESFFKVLNPPKKTPMEMHKKQTISLDFITHYE
ncbi:MAG: hypothetical protein BWY27_00438 [Bacteroidetes bacterium ADurb.Bin234]|nr:MAG: hypothetical protein BWY27_00438 [Bacteroidetes bacterium ADurb.Bin234]